MFKLSIQWEAQHGWKWWWIGANCDGNLVIIRLSVNKVIQTVNNTSAFHFILVLNLFFLHLILCSEDFYQPYFTLSAPPNVLVSLEPSRVIWETQNVGTIHIVKLGSRPSPGQLQMPPRSSPIQSLSQIQEVWTWVDTIIAIYHHPPTIKLFEVFKNILEHSRTFQNIS